LALVQLVSIHRQRKFEQRVVVLMRARVVERFAGKNVKVVVGWVRLLFFAATMPGMARSDESSDSSGVRAGAGAIWGR